MTILFTALWTIEGIPMGTTSTKMITSEILAHSCRAQLLEELDSR